MKYAVKLGVISAITLLALSVQAKESPSDFDKAEKSLLPLSALQINVLHKDTLAISGAVNRLPANVSRVIAKVSLEPGAQSPSITITPGYVTSIRFVDAAGNPWPITSNTIGNSSWFSLNKPEGLKPGNMLTLAALSPKSHTNMLVTLKNLNASITLSVKTDDVTRGPSSAVNGSITLQVPGLSPLASPVETASTPSVVNDNMLSVLNNLMPEGASKLNSDDKAVEFWRFDDYMYIRSSTSAHLVYPAYFERSHSGSVTVYKVPVSGRVIMSSPTGRMRHINVDI